MHQTFSSHHIFASLTPTACPQPQHPHSFFLLPQDNECPCELLSLSHPEHSEAGPSRAYLGPHMGDFSTHQPPVTQELSLTHSLEQKALGLCDGPLPRPRSSLLGAKVLGNAQPSVAL